MATQYGTSRARLRIGRRVLYYPTSAEQTANGKGPWNAVIVAVAKSGACDLDVDVPTVSSVGAALASPLVTSPDGSDAASTQTLANETKADVNAVVTRVNEIRTRATTERKTGVKQTGKAGGFSLMTR